MALVADTALNHHSLRLITSGFGGGGRRGRVPPFWNSKEGLQGGSKRAHAPCAPPFEIPKRVFKEGQRGRTPPAPPFWNSKEGLQTGPPLRPPPLSTNPGSALAYNSMLFMSLFHLYSFNTEVHLNSLCVKGLGSHGASIAILPCHGCTVDLRATVTVRQYCG